MSPLRTAPVRTSFSTNDEMVAREALDAAFVDAEIRVRSEPGRAARMTLESVALPELMVAETTVPLQVEGVFRGDGYVFTTLAGGTAEYEGLFPAARYGRGDTWLVSDGSTDVRGRGSASTAQSWTLSRALLDEVVAQHPDSPVAGWRFTAAVPRIDGARQWRRAAATVRELLSDADASCSELVMGPAARLLAATALTAWPNTALAERPRADGPDAHRESLRRAVAFIEANLELDISIGDVARAARVSTRAVQLAFSRHLDTTPMRYLRQVRLHEARGQLEAATGGDGTTVTRVAMDWGFANPSHFTTAYRAAFGELPRETLRR